jgi:hypothetical protein
MFYPSHFPRDFLGSMEYLPRAKYIYQEGTKRSAYMVEGRSIIRPYVQAFRIGGELAFDRQVYSTFLVNQVQGSLQGAGSGFTLWNASNDYYMVTVPLGPIIQGSANGTIVARREAVALGNITVAPGDITVAPGDITVAPGDIPRAGAPEAAEGVDQKGEAQR